MSEDPVFSDLAIDAPSSTKSDEAGDREHRVTSVMQDPLFNEFEQWRKERGISRSKAIRELVEDGMAGEHWGDRVEDAQDALEVGSNVAFAVSALSSDGSGNVQIATRRGLENPFPVDVDEKGQAVVIAMVHLIDAYAELADSDFSEILHAIGQMKEVIDEHDDGDQFYIRDER